MAFINAIKYKIGRELVERVHFGVSAGARKSANAYQNLKTSHPRQAIYHIRRAVDMPNRTRWKIDELIDYLIASDNVDLVDITTIPEANQFLIECLAFNNIVTAAELNIELSAHEAYSISVKDDIEANISNLPALNTLEPSGLIAADWAYLDQVANNLITHYSSDIVRLWNFQIDVNAYINVFGVSGEY